MTSLPNCFEKLNGVNYVTWALVIMDHLKQQGLWRIVEGSERMPSVPTAMRYTQVNQASMGDPKYTFIPASMDPVYLQRYELFLAEWERYQNRCSQACGTICMAMEPFIRQRYQEDAHNDPKMLWTCIKDDSMARNAESRLDGFTQMQRLATCKLENYRSVAEWINAQNAIVLHLAMCGIKVEDRWRSFYLLWNLPKTFSWRAFKASLQQNVMVMSSATIITHLATFEASGRHGGGTEARLNSTFWGSAEAPGQRKAIVKAWVCYGCGERGHKQAFCRHAERYRSISVDIDGMKSGGNSTNRATITNDHRESAILTNDANDANDANGADGADGANDADDEADADDDDDDDDDDHKEFYVGAN